MFKKKLCGALLAGAVAIGVSGQASANDPCQQVLCMFGLVTVGEVEGCAPSIQGYFSIVRFDSDGDFSPGATKQARDQSNGQCPTADPAALTQISEKFGTVLR